MSLCFNDDSLTIKFYNPDTKSYMDPKKREKVKCAYLVDKILTEEAGLKLGRIWINS